MQNSGQSLPRFVLLQSLVTVSHTCVSIMLNISDTIFVQNLIKKSYGYLSIAFNWKT